MRPTIYEAAGGKQGILDLAHAWHRRCMDDAIVSHAFSHGFNPDHTERLAAYWAEALGGPSEYTDSMGDESFVVRMHAGNGVHPEMDERALQCFVVALDDVGFSNNTELCNALKAYFARGLEIMAEYPNSANDVPGQLPFKTWSWDGTTLD